MKPSTTSATTTTTATTDVLTTPNFIKFTALVLISLSFLLFTHYLSSSSSTTSISFSLQPPSQISPIPPPQFPEIVRTGIIDETGAMSWNFEIGEFYLHTDSDEEFNDLIGANENQAKENTRNATVGKFQVCEHRLRDYVPCFDNEEENNQRHCPQEVFHCRLPIPKAYKHRIPWPDSRDEVWLSNVANTSLVENKTGQNWIQVKEDKLIFPGEDGSIDSIIKMVPEIGFGNRTRMVLDVDSGIASFGAYLMQHNVTTLSVAAKNVSENQIQLALERGVPAMVAVFATRRLLYPSQAFDLIHCSRCRVNWTRDDGILLLEANRMLRAGGYFVLAAEPVHKDGEIELKQWREMKNLTTCICWELVKKEGYVGIWRKPLNNSCYLNRDAGAQPPICDSNDDPGNVWYVGLKACIMRLPENGYGANPITWPARLHHPPDRLHSIKMDADISRKEIFRAESKYWNDIVDSYVRAYRWKEYKLRNVMDMRAGFGGFAAALHDLQIGCWVMNVVPVSGFNTLPVIYDRGLVGVMHDWCEPFDTYPRTYDLLHAAGLFSVEQKRCNISTIMLEMDRILRPDGRVYIRDSVSVMGEVQELASAMGWVNALHETGEGPHASWKVLICEKRLIG